MKKQPGMYAEVPDRGAPLQAPVDSIAVNPGAAHRQSSLPPESGHRSPTSLFGLSGRPSTPTRIAA